MAPRTRTRRVYERVRRRVTRRKDYDLKRGLKGLAAGLAVAVPLSFAARYMAQPILFEAGERAGAIAATKFGGTWGQVLFQGVDALIERAIPRIAGGPGGGIGRVAEAYG